MRTLSADDPSYRPDYVAGLDSDDPLVARGANYHQGPEWGWLLAAHLRALLSTADPGDIDRDALLARLSPHRHLLRRSPWHGLPELTNCAGAPCADSCPTQAWTMAGFLEVLVLLDRHCSPP